MKSPRFATVGDNCIDRYAPPISLSAVGGNAVNVAVRLCQLGMAVSYFGAVGDDSDGRRVTSRLVEAGVDSSAVVIGKGHTASTELIVDAAGERMIGAEDFGACASYRPSRSKSTGWSEWIMFTSAGWPIRGSSSKP